MKTSEILCSFYSNNKATEKRDIDIDAYFNMVQAGTYQDFVITSRLLKQKGNLEKYKESKNSAPCITGSAIMNHGSKSANNVLKLNGLIVIDIDENLPENIVKALQADKYSYIMHRSFGGDGFAIFVKINPDRFLDSFNGLAQYYFDNYQVTIDPACKNTNRLRYISYDPEAFLNENSLKFVPKDVKKFREPKKVEFIYTESDFTNILHQITDRNIDLCNEEYFRYVRIGLALANKFGLSGIDHFHYICQFGQKYNKERTDKDYKGFCRNPDGATKIGTFYYYCKEAGIDIYSQKTKQIINSVKVLKSQGKPTIESVSSHIKVTHEIVADSQDTELIKALIESNHDYSEDANADKSETEQLIDYILEAYNPTFDMVSKEVFMNEKLNDDATIDNIYLNAKALLGTFVTKNDVKSVLNAKVPRIDVLGNFFKENQSNVTGLIEQMALCLHPQTEYNVWAFKKWIVGMIHNMVRPQEINIVSPLTLVLCGQKQGTGKTTFIRNILPKELQKYYIETKLSGKDKDSMKRLATNLIVADDEFGGKAFKDAKEYKAISDQNKITMRLPYGASDVSLSRIATLCGTTNEIDILKDVTGNRRILPINVNSIDFETMLKIDKASMLIEAYNLYKIGFEWQIYKSEDTDYILKNTEQNQEQDPFEDIFFEHFQLEKSTEYFYPVIYNRGKILLWLNDHTGKIQVSKFDIARVITKYKIVEVQWDGKKSIRGCKLFMKTHDGAIDEKPPF